MKNRRRFVAVLFAGLVALVAAGPVFASCECDIVAQSPWFTLHWQDTCPTASAGELEKNLNEVVKKELLQRMAHGVAFASQSWRLVQNNPDLRAALSAAPVDLYKPEGKTWIVSADDESLVDRFRKADQSSVATLYTVRVGSYGSRDAARNALRQWSFLRRPEKGAAREPALQDSLLSVTWRYSSCAGAWDPDLFILPQSGRYDLDFRLLIEPKDAERIARLLEPRLMTRTEVVPVQVTASVLAIALSQ